jgi:hypothetical protein
VSGVFHGDDLRMRVACDFKNAMPMISRPLFRRARIASLDDF